MPRLPLARNHRMALVAVPRRQWEVAEAGHEQMWAQPEAAVVEERDQRQRGPQRAGTGRGPKVPHKQPTEEGPFGERRLTVAALDKVKLLTELEVVRLVQSQEVGAQRAMV